MADTNDQIEQVPDGMIVQLPNKPSADLHISTSTSFHFSHSTLVAQATQA